MNAGFLSALDAPNETLELSVVLEDFFGGMIIFIFSKQKCNEAELCVNVKKMERVEKLFSYIFKM